MKILIYDCEIIKGILKKGEKPLDGIDYCAGWHDHENMGISVIVAYDYTEQRYGVFMEDNFNEFQYLINKSDIVIGFNSLAFDNKLCKANGIEIPDRKSWDLLCEIWKSDGLEPVFQYPSHIGYSLDNVAMANLGECKSGSGAMAPVDWQRGNIGAVVDYCLQDVRLTKLLVDRIIDTRHLINPRDTGSILYIDPPGSQSG